MQHLNLVVDQDGYVRIGAPTDAPKVSWTQVQDVLDSIDLNEIEQVAMRESSMAQKPQIGERTRATIGHALYGLFHDDPGAHPPSAQTDEQTSVVVDGTNQETVD